MGQERITLPAELGEIVGGYRLDSMIAMGGMGCVYAATHARLGRRAAVKVLVSSLAADEAYVERFFNEAKVVNAVRHPNIVDVFDFVESENPKRVAFVMELIDGPSLSSVVAKRPLSVLQVINVSLQLVGVLDAVHRIDVVHRDLKPDNILVTAPVTSDMSMVPSVKVLDFGIAKINAPNRVTSTMPGSIMGTPAYMSPEQIAGLSVSASADIYALGAIMFEMLAGRRLFPGEVMAVFKAKLIGQEANLELPSNVRFPPLLRELIAKCVSMEAKHRPHLAEIRARLLEARRSETDAPELPPYEPPRAPAIISSPFARELDKTIVPTLDRLDQRKTSRAMIAVLICALLAGAGAAFVVWSRGEEPKPTPAVLPLPVMPAPPVTPVVEEKKPEPPPPPVVDEAPVEEKKPVPVSKPAKREPAVKPAAKSKKAPLKRDDMVPW